ncbi:MAG: hypothetical protein U1E49_00280 [Hyphomicrobiaceae bacterium]
MQIHPSVKDVLKGILPASMYIAEEFGLPFDYGAGNRPRHICGNLIEPQKVQILLFLAEPGSNPGPSELNRPVETWLSDISSDGLGNGGCTLLYRTDSKNDYERRPAEFLARIWPSCDSKEIMKKTIITNSFWMQAERSGGKIPIAAERAFSEQLGRIRGAFPNSLVVAAGNKAQRRCKFANFKYIPMAALSRPGCNHKSSKASHLEVSDRIRREFAS